MPFPFLFFPASKGVEEGESLFDRAPRRDSASARERAMPNAYYGKGSVWGASQELEPFFACVEEA